MADSILGARDPGIIDPNEKHSDEQKDESSTIEGHASLKEDRNETDENVDEHSETFNLFQYWKNPLPLIDIDSDLTGWDQQDGIGTEGCSASGIPEVRVTDSEKPDEVLYFSKELNETMSDFEEEISLNSSETLAENSIQDHERILAQVCILILFLQSYLLVRNNRRSLQCW